MAPPTRTVDGDRLAQWCQEHLGSPPVAELFRTGHLSTVVGLRLADDRAVVVKIRPAAPRLAGCVEVQRRLFRSGYPCPEPLTGAHPFDADTIATAETYVPGGASLPDAERAPDLFAAAFARLIALAPRPDEVGTLDPPPSWADWNHSLDGVWPRPEDTDIDLNAAPDAGWIDEVGRQARARLQAAVPTGLVVGHCDWLAGNLRWSGDALLVVHDWDSVVVADEAVLVGLAAALYSTVDPDRLATVADTERFLAGYGRARGRALDDDERERAWAAGVWTRAYDAKYQHAIGQPVTSLSEPEARTRLRRTQTG